MTIIAHHPMHAHMRNIGSWERGVRLFVGTAAAGLAFTAGPIWLRALLAVIAAGGIATSIVGYCPINRLIGRDSCHRNVL